MICGFGEDEGNPLQDVDRFHETSDTDRNPEGENNPEDLSDHSTSLVLGRADVEQMTLEMGDGKAKVDSEALTSMADSTMKDSLGSADASESIEIHCCIERVKSNHSLCPSVPFKDLEHDSKVVIPSETTFCDLVQTVLRHLQYSDTDVLGARGMIVIKNWKPVTLDAITDDPWAKVGDILGGLTMLVTLKIHLCNFSKFRVMEDVKDKLLFFLLKNSQELLQQSGCPIKQTAFEEILGDTSNFPDDLRSLFDDWYKDQARYKSSRPTASDAKAFTNGYSSSIREESPKSQLNGHFKSEDPFASANGRVTLPAAKSRSPALGRLWVDHDADRSRVKHHRKDGLLLRASGRHDPLPVRHQTAASELNECHFNLVDVFSAGRHALVESNTRHRQRTELVASQPASTTLKDEREADAKQELDKESDEDEWVPELPNKNAVYVIRPLPVSSSGSESMEVVLANNELEFDDLPATPEPQDLSKTVSSSTTANGSKHKDHNRLGETMPENVDFPTNLSLRDASKSLFKASKEVPKANGVIDQSSSKRFGVFSSESPKKLKSMQYDDDDNGFDDAYIHNGEPCSPKLPTRIPPAFGILPHLQALHHHHQQQQQHTASHLLAMSNTMNFMRQFQGPVLPINQPFQDYIHDNLGGSDSEHKKRSRVFIDPLSETPKLERWFAIDSHPSTATIEEFTNELNQSIYRQRFPKLEPKNVQLWFKNHRAKVKRLKSEPTTDGI